MIESKYSSIERQSNGKWIVFNDVTGMAEPAELSLFEAKNRMYEINSYYAAIECGCFQVAKQ